MSRNSEEFPEPHPSRTNMDLQSISHTSPSTPARSTVPGSTSTRKKACRKCTQSKVRCDLAKPKCNRCAARGNPCEYPASRSQRPNARTSEYIHTPTETIQNHGTFDVVSSGINPPGQTRQNAEVWPPARADVPVQSHPDLSLFRESDLVPMIDAGEIRDRWLRPYISASTGQEPKQLNLHTIQYLTCVLKSYLRNLSNSVFPPFVHYSQCTQGRSPVLSYCCANLRMWIGRSPEYEIFILGTIRDEMKKIEDQVRL